MELKNDTESENVSECESCKACGKNMTPDECQTIEYNWRDDPKHETIMVKPKLPQKQSKPLVSKIP
jgi:hypothetical protein